ncbi:SpoIIE family protein phosphatase [Pontibacter sp. KCTC 32443]|uniref:ATP-binding protein n=1 Tax=Pontibacter TaxID=323449 RepID=UPI00164E69C5|nr:MULTISPECIES: ATP-binding protein [Pontibacter]MBC5772827.1 SpoIIE family protein phosphatase [Pontibacter sp. KCTC 32443]
MDVKHYQRFLLADRSFANIVKRDITRLAESHGFSPAEVGRINIVVSEMASNLHKHSPQGGELLVKYTEDNAIEILCLDFGPGMKEPHRMMQDGTSTTGTAGEGLGAIMRQSHTFDMFSCAGCGTVLLSRIYKGSTSAPKKNVPFEIGALLVPKPNEQFCGDGFAMSIQGRSCEFIALDGLGHGAAAQDASTEAARVFLNNHSLDPVSNLRQIHQAIRKTRGAVGTIVHIDLGLKRMSYCGIGNIAGRLYTIDGPGIVNASSKSIIAYNGILGHNIPTTLNSQQQEWNKSSLLILHSDGIKSRYDLSKYTNLHRHDVSIIAAVLYRDFRRDTDDSLVVVVRSKS